MSVSPFATAASVAVDRRPRWGRSRHVLVVIAIVLGSMSAGVVSAPDADASSCTSGFNMFTFWKTCTSSTKMANGCYADEIHRWVNFSLVERVVVFDCYDAANS